MDLQTKIKNSGLLDAGQKLRLSLLFDKLTPRQQLALESVLDDEIRTQDQAMKQIDQLAEQKIKTIIKDAEANSQDHE